MTGGSLALPNAMGQAWQVFVVPLRRAALSLGNDEPCALVVVADPNSTATLDADQLRSLFALTAAEARLASALGSGSSLEAYAEQQGLSINTVRSQLRAVLHRTGTHRQADLMRLLNAAPRLVR